jgi:hypothetical protein
MKRHLTALALALALSTGFNAPTANAALFLIAPPAWGGVVAGAALLGTGVGLHELSYKIKNKPARVTALVSTVVLGVIGFLVMDDQTLHPVLNEFPSNAQANELLEANQLSRTDAEIYNRERLSYQAVIESVVNAPEVAKLSKEQRAQILANEAAAAGISSSTLRVAGLIDAIAQSVN